MGLFAGGAGFFSCVHIYAHSGFFGIKFLWLLGPLTVSLRHLYSSLFLDCKKKERWGWMLIFASSVILITELNSRKGWCKFFLWYTLPHMMWQKFVGKLKVFLFIGFVGFFLLQSKIVSLHCFALEGLLQKYWLLQFVMCIIKTLVSCRNISFKLWIPGRVKSVCGKSTTYYPCCINFSE